MYTQVVNQMSKWVLRSVQLLKVKIPIWTSDNPVMSDTITNHTMHTLKLEIGMLAISDEPEPSWLEP